ncbi:hypothetical protein ABFX02_06G100700 [Erythranthe guttata]
MGFEVDDRCEPNSTPKLTLSKLPFSKPIREPLLMMQTPPLRPSVSIPFRWEEAPGKPRSAATAAASSPPSSRCTLLDLPPRLTPHDDDDAKITVMSSPTDVFDGPYVGRSMSLACTFSFRKGPVAEVARPSKRDGGARNFDSGRWASFSDEEGKFVKGSFDFSHTLGDFFRREENVNATRVRRRRSLFNLAAINSNSWANICATIKQAAVPWRRRRSRR